MSRKWTYFFFIALIGVSFFYGYEYILFMRPGSIHQWRQCDCLSLAYNYYMEGMHFFNPTIHWSGATGDGKTCTSECPWLYYTIAGLWKVFGYHEFIYRLFDTLIMYTGLYFLFKLTKELLQDGAWAIIVSLFIFSSTVFVYYGNNFMTDVPSLSIAFIAWYYFLKFYKSGSSRTLYIWIFFCLLAGLTKITALLSFVPVFFILPLELFNITRFKGETKLFDKPFKQIIPLVILVITIVLWTLYAMHYNSKHIAGVFSTETFPIYHMTGDEIHNVSTQLYNSLLPAYFSMPVLFLVLILFIALLLNRKSVNKIMLYITTGTFAGCVLYILLWFKVLNVHDYYLINLLIFIPVVLVTFLYFLKKKYPAILYSVKTKIIALIILLFSIYNCSVAIHLRYNPNAKIVLTDYILDKPTVDFWQWFHWNYKNHFQSLETVTPYLRSLGIQRSDKVISMPDQSINISLYLMDQKGYTDFAFNELKREYRMNEFIKSGAKYLILNDSTYRDSAWMKPYIMNKMGRYSNLFIYDLRHIEVQNVEAIITRQRKIDTIKNNIRSTPEWILHIKQAAAERKISVDSALELNAIWELDHSQQSK